MTQHARAFKKIIGESITSQGGGEFALRTSSGTLIATPSSLHLHGDLAIELVDDALVISSPGGRVAYVDDMIVAVPEEKLHE